MPLIHTSPELREIHEKRKAGTWRPAWQPPKFLQSMFCLFGRHGSNVEIVDCNQAFQHFRCAACKREWKVDVN